MAEFFESKTGQEEKRRRRSRKGESRRAEILSAAMRRFAEDGYQNAAIGDIARDVGLSLPGKQEIDIGRKMVQQAGQ
ncbi:hypothetical protein ACC790_38500, partial [Rhizobium johnstonii]